MKPKTTVRPGIAPKQVTRVNGRPATRSQAGLKLSLILVPIDFSELSLKALQYATALAQQFHAGIFLLHVVEPAPVMTGEFGLTNSVVYDIQPLQRHAARQLSAWGKEIVSPAAVKTAVRTGNPYHEIVAAARDSDLIVIGTHGRTGWGHVLVGSTAERVVRLAPCPVLVVREHERDFIKPATAHARRQQSDNRRAVGVNRLTRKQAVFS